MQGQISRLPDVTRKTGLSRSSIYSQMASGTFPRSIKLGQRAIGWLESDIDKWIAKRVTESQEVAA